MKQYVGKIKKVIFLENNDTILILDSGSKSGYLSRVVIDRKTYDHHFKDDRKAIGQLIHWYHKRKGDKFNKIGPVDSIDKWIGSDQIKDKMIGTSIDDIEEMLS